MTTSPRPAPQSAEGIELVLISEPLLWNVTHALGSGTYRHLSDETIETLRNGCRAAIHGLYVDGDPMPEIHPGLPWEPRDPAIAQEKAVRLINQLQGAFEDGAGSLHSASAAATTRAGVEAIAKHLGLIS